MYPFKIAGKPAHHIGLIKIIFSAHFIYSCSAFISSGVPPLRKVSKSEAERTLNELYGQGTYAEIDSQTASDLKAGLNSIADEINYYIKLNDINNSASLKIQDRTAVRKNILVYDRFNEMSKITFDIFDTQRMSTAETESSTKFFLQKARFFRSFRRIRLKHKILLLTLQLYARIFCVTNPKEL